MDRTLAIRAAILAAVALPLLLAIAYVGFRPEDDGAEDAVREFTALIDRREFGELYDRTYNPGGFTRDQFVACYEKLTPMGHSVRVTDVTDRREEYDNLYSFRVTVISSDGERERRDWIYRDGDQWKKWLTEDAKRAIVICNDI